MPLYGHELNESITPIQAGLDFAVKFEGREFIGRDALISAKAQRESLPVRVGLMLAGRRAGREHYPVLAGEQVIGEVTSGTFSPTLEQPISMAYVPQEYAAEGTELAVDIRGRAEVAKVVSLPFYRRQS
jgi:aminomethyltransferase